MRQPIVALLLLCSAVAAQAQWDEKYRWEIKITPDNAVSQYLRANFGKVGEIAAQKLEAILNDPKQQAKMAKSAIQYITQLYNDSTKTPEDKSREFLRLIDADVEGFSSAPSGSAGVVAGFSARYNVMRLSWTPDINTYVCQKSTAVCNGVEVLPGSMCYTRELIGGQYYDRSYPAPITVTSFNAAEEAEYTIYRNQRPLAQISGRQAMKSDSINSVDFARGGASFTLSLGLPSRPNISGSTPVFYDYDPYQGAVGTPLSYKIVSTTSGCGPKFNNSYTGSHITYSDITVDANGDAQPDFYPLEELRLRREGSATVPVTPLDPNRTPFDYTYAMNKTGATLYRDAAWTQFVAQLDAARRAKFGVGVVTDPTVVLEGFDQGLRLCGRAPLQCSAGMNGSDYSMSFSIMETSTAGAWSWSISYKKKP